MKIKAKTTTKIKIDSEHRFVTYTDYTYVEEASLMITVGVFGILTAFTIFSPIL